MNVCVRVYTVAADSNEVDAADVRCEHRRSASTHKREHVMIARRLCCLSTAFLLLPALAGHAYAQRYPERPIRMIVPFPPGGSTDFLARAVGQRLTDVWGQPVIIDNRPGASGNIGCDIAAKAPADGYTTVVTSMSQAISMTYYRKLPYSLTGDLHGVSLFATQPNALLAFPGLPVKSIQDLIALAKAKPGQLTYASAGNGSSQHLMGELLKGTVKIDLIHVPYKGTGIAITDLMGGQISLMFGPLVTAIPSVKAGKLRALAVTSPKRAPAAPEVPTMIESGVPGYDVVSWYGVHAPIKTPRPVIDALNREINRILTTAEVHDRLINLGMDPAPITADQFQAMSKSEVARWAKVIKESGTKQE
jgi:tripartite-type tricarboxylate transporter receptor subunit TctC